MALPNSLARLIWGRTGGSGQYRFQGEPPALEEQQNDLERFFWAHNGPVVHKWLHYFEIYDRYFARFRNTPVRFLEIGVAKGGSLEMWRSYFGEDAVIFGIDIDPACAAFDGQSGAVRIGSQADGAFLAKVVDEMGGVDVVLDDGSHDSLHIRASLDVLFPRLSDGGVYMVEDLQAAYWPGFTGGYRRRASFMSVIKTLIDDIHHWYHPKGQRIDATADALDSIHVHDSITVLEKRMQKRPANIQRGEGCN